MSQAAGRRCSFVLAVLLLAVPAASAFADSSQRLEPIEPDHYQRAWFVPRLTGALSIDIQLLSTLSRNPAATAAGFGTSVGWREYFDGHGLLSVRAFGLFEVGGALDGSIYGSSTRYGGGVAFTARALSEDFLLVALSVFADGGLLRMTPPENAFFGAVDEPEIGSQFTIGLETTVGSLFLLNPYMFGETGGVLSITTINLPSISTFEFWARWVLRFDWAIPRAGD